MKPLAATFLLWYVVDIYYTVVYAHNTRECRQCNDTSYTCLCCRVLVVIIVLRCLLLLLLSHSSIAYNIQKINDISAIPHDNGETVYYAHAGAVPDVGTFFYGKVALTQEFSTKLIVHNATTVQNEVCEPGYDAFLPTYQSPINERVQFCTTTSDEVCDVFVK